MTPVTILPEAEAELWEAVAFYEQRGPGLGKDFACAIKAAIEMVQRFPERGMLRKDETRRVLIHRFPYLLVYTCQHQRIWVVAFAHCRRKPNYWTPRVKSAE